VEQVEVIFLIIITIFFKDGFPHWRFYLDPASPCMNPIDGHIFNKGFWTEGVTLETILTHSMINNND
jgi:hypothetical protein